MTAPAPGITSTATESESFATANHQVSGRLVWQPLLSDDNATVLHVGASGRTFQPDNDVVRIKSKPENNLAPQVLDTGSIPSKSAQTYGVEMFYRKGAWLAGTEWNWEKVYSAYIEKTKAGQMSDHLVRGGFSSGYIKLSPYGAAVSDAIKAKAEDAKAKLTAGTLVIYQGPLKDNAGKEIVAAGAKHDQTDITLESMNYLVEGVKGKLN